MKTLFSLLAIALLTGCVAPRMNTASGAPEVTIKAPMASVRSRLAAAIADRGFTITRADDLLIEGRADAGTTAAVLFATPMDPSAYRVMRVNLFDTSAGVRVISRTFLVAGGVDQGEIVRGRDQVQLWLDSLATDLEAKAKL